MLAAAGSVVLIQYVRTADVRASAGAEFVSAYVVETEVPAGTRAEDIENYLSVREIPALAAVPGRVTSLRDLNGLVSEVTLKPGEQLISSRWADPLEIDARGSVALPEGMQAVTIALPVERVVGGSVHAGDTVGIVISARAKEEDSDGDAGEEVALTTQSFHKVLVLNVQPGTAFLPVQEGAEGAGATRSDPVDALMVTVALTTPGVEALVWGREFGSLWLTLEPATADETGSRVVDVNVLFR